MKTRMYNRLAGLLLTLSVVLLFPGCGDDLIVAESLDDDTTGEKVVLELKDHPAYVVEEKDGYVTICYADRVDEIYGEAFLQDLGDEVFMDIQLDAMRHLMAVKAEDFRSYGIDLCSGVYVTASVTNKACAYPVAKWYQPDRAEPVFLHKAYLKGLRPRTQQTGGLDPSQNGR